MGRRLHGFDPGLSVSRYCSKAEELCGRGHREAEKAPSGGSRPACSARAGRGLTLGSCSPVQCFRDATSCSVCLRPLWLAFHGSPDLILGDKK